MQLIEEIERENDISIPKNTHFVELSAGLISLYWYPWDATVIGKIHKVKLLLDRIVTKFRNEALLVEILHFGRKLLTGKMHPVYRNKHIHVFEYNRQNYM